MKAQTKAGMGSWKRVAGVALLVTAALTGTSALAQGKAPASGSPIVIGMLEDTSGGASFYSQLTGNAVKVAVVAESPHEPA